MDSCCWGKPSPTESRKTQSAEWEYSVQRKSLVSPQLIMMWDRERKVSELHIWEESTCSQRYRSTQIIRHIHTNIADAQRWDRLCVCVCVSHFETFNIYWSEHLMVRFLSGDKSHWTSQWWKLRNRTKPCCYTPDTVLHQEVVLIQLNTVNSRLTLNLSQMYY